MRRTQLSRPRMVLLRMHPHPTAASLQQMQVRNISWTVTHCRLDVVQWWKKYSSVRLTLVRCQFNTNLCFVGRDYEAVCNASNALWCSHLLRGQRSSCCISGCSFESFLCKAHGCGSALLAFEEHKGCYWAAAKWPRKRVFACNVNSNGHLRD